MCKMFSELIKASPDKYGVILRCFPEKCPSVYKSHSACTFFFIFVHDSNEKYNTQTKHI